MEKSVGRKMAFYCSIVLIVGGLLFVLHPLWAFFDAVILPSFQTANTEQLYAARYLALKGIMGLMFAMMGWIGWKVAGPEKKRNKEHDAGLLRAENDSLHKKVEELEKASQNVADREEIARLKMLLEDSETARTGISDELEVKIFELALVRQELEDLKAVHGDGPKLRTMWRYVLELEGRGMTDSDIRNALIGDGFKNPAIDALLYMGKGANYSAVTKYFQRH